MCGRYVVSTSPADLADEFDIDELNVKETWEPDYNVAPTKTSPVVVARRPKDAPEDAEPVRQLRKLRWGLVPSWAKDPKVGGARMINARSETVHEKPSFRRAFAVRRSLIPAEGFYEWFPTQELSKAGKPLKQPFFLRPKDGLLTMAGLYEFWRDRDKPDDHPDAWLITFTIITTQATDDVGHIHDRMPMIVTPDRWSAWLDPRLTDPDDVRPLMTPPTPGTLDVYPVSKAVNNVKNNGPELTAPLPPD